jgi:hypothetical protein
MARGRSSGGGDPVTLGWLADQGTGLKGCCNECGRSGPADLADAMERFGRDRTVPSLNRFMRCTRCGSRWTEARPDYALPPGQRG